MCINDIYILFNNQYILILILLAIFIIFGFRRLAMLMDSLDMAVKNKENNIEMTIMVKKQKSRADSTDSAIMVKKEKRSVREWKIHTFTVTHITNEVNFDEMGYATSLSRSLQSRPVKIPEADKYYIVNRVEEIRGDFTWRKPCQILWSLDLRICLNEIGLYTPFLFSTEFSEIMQKSFGPTSEPVLQNCLPLPMANSHRKAISDKPENSRDIFNEEEQAGFKESKIRVVRFSILYESALILGACHEAEDIADISSDARIVFLPFKGAMPIQSVPKGLLEKNLEKEMQKKKCTNYLRFHNKPCFKYGPYRNKHDICYRALLYCSIAEKENDI
ncbi:hypothetical protein XENTR_v10011622 [Xenopus tropicalis]|nr:hypothetical protein XENTR_v10011622 [Xenopus tropicalis]